MHNSRFAAQAPTGTASSRPPRGAWLMVLMLCIFMMINFADKAIIGLAAGPIMHELHLTNEEFGRVGSAFFLFFSASAVLVGFVANRVRTKTVIAVMAITWAIVQLPMLGTVTLPLLIANRIILGAGEGPAYPVALHALFKWFKNDQRTFPTALVSIGTVLGTGISAPLLTWIIVHYNWHVAFGALGAIGLVWTVVWLVVGREGPLCATPQPGCQAVSGVSYFRLLTTRSVLGAIVGAFAAYWALTLAVVWLPAFLVKGSGYSPVEAGWIVTLPSIMQIFFAPTAGYLSQRMMGKGISSRVARGTFGGTCLLVGGCALAALSVNGNRIVEIALVVLSFSVGSIMVNFGAAVVAEVSPIAKRGGMLGIYNAAYTLAGMVAPWVMGHCVDSGVTIIDGFHSGFALSGAVVVTGGLLAITLIAPKRDIAMLMRSGESYGELDPGMPAKAH